MVTITNTDIHSVRLCQHLHLSSSAVCKALYSLSLIVQKFSTQLDCSELSPRFGAAKQWGYRQVNLLLSFLHSYTFYNHLEGSYRCFYMLCRVYYSWFETYAAGCDFVADMLVCCSVITWCRRILFLGLVLLIKEHFWVFFFIISCCFPSLHFWKLVLQHCIRIWI